MDVIRVRHEKLTMDEGFQFTPTYSNDGSVGVDLYAHFPLGTSSMTLFPGRTLNISAGIKIRIPNGYEGQIRPVTWLAETYGVTVLNSPGSIDSNHTDLVRVLLINHGDIPYVINYCANIAQLVLVKIAKIAFVSAEEIDNSEDSDFKLENEIVDVDNHVSVIVKSENI